MIPKLYLSAAMQNVPLHNAQAFFHAEEHFRPAISLNPVTLGNELVAKFADKHDITYDHYLAYDILHIIRFNPEWFMFIKTHETHWSYSFGCGLEFAIATQLDKMKFEWCTYSPVSITPISFANIQKPQYELNQLAIDIIKRISQFNISDPCNCFIHINIIAEMINYYTTKLNIFSHETAESEGPF